VTAKERLDQHDRQIAAIRTLVKEGIELVRQNAVQIKQLAAAQRKTDASLRAFLDGMKRGNGHTKAKLDIQ